MWHRARKDILSALTFVCLTCLIMAAFYTAGNGPPAAGKTNESEHLAGWRRNFVPTHRIISVGAASREAASNSPVAKPAMRGKVPRPVVRHRPPFMAETPGFVAATPARSDGDRQKEAKSKKNLATLAAAFHVYHQAHGHFPPATVLGPDGKTPHSWRVELLPQLSQKLLYEQYRLTEPWDSPKNLKVLSQMPAVFHSPYDRDDSRNSSYFAFVGPGTVFEGTKGISISQIVDGTNNTLLVAECCRNVPWTKPEDILFDPAVPQPKFGGFISGKMAGVMVDGEYRLLSVDEQFSDELAGLIIRDDRRPIGSRKVTALD